AIAIAAYNDEIKTLQTVIADDERTIALVRTRLDNGAASRADLLRAQSQLDSDRALLPPLNQGRAAARNALAVLTGRVPGDWLPPDFSLAQFTLPAELPVALPSTLARRRPDIAVAEAELHAASAAIGVAEAARYPDITLSAAMLPLAATPAGLFEASNLLWTFGGSLAAPVYKGGALEARERQAKAEYDAAMANYRDTVVKAFGQVADVLNALQNDAALTAAQRRTVASAGEATELARIRYRDGAASLNDVLDAERVYQQAKLSLVDAEARRYRDSADLMAALGGGWKARG
ncbi:MAG: efflux transporter outer membrane subunit, partial [Ferrovibrionaceae bacterium]